MISNERDFTGYRQNSLKSYLDDYIQQYERKVLDSGMSR